MLLSLVLLRLTGYEIHALFFFLTRMWCGLLFLDYFKFRSQKYHMDTWGHILHVDVLCGRYRTAGSSWEHGAEGEGFSLRSSSCCCWQRIWRHMPSCRHSRGTWGQESVWDQAGWLGWSLIPSPPFLLAFEVVSPNSGSCWTSCVAQPGLEPFYPLAFTSQVPGPQMWPPWLGIAGFLFSQESSQQALCDSRSSARGLWTVTWQ